MFLKNCPKCGGDVSEEEDFYGLYTHCVQCGYHEEDFADREGAEEPSARRRIPLFRYPDQEGTPGVLVPL